MAAWHAESGVIEFFLRRSGNRRCPDNQWQVAPVHRVVDSRLAKYGDGNLLIRDVIGQRNASRRQAISSIKTRSSSRPKPDPSPGDRK